MAAGKTTRRRRRAPCVATTTHALPPLVKRNAERLCALANASVPQARKILKTAPADFLRCLSLVASNVLKGNVPIRSSTIRRLTPYAKNFRKFARRTLSSATRRATALRGGFLPALLGVLASVVAPALLKAVTGRGG